MHPRRGQVARAVLGIMAALALLAIAFWLGRQTRQGIIGPGPLTTAEPPSPAPPATWRTASHDSIPREEIDQYIDSVDTLVNTEWYFGDSTRLAVGVYPAMTLGPLARIEPVRGSASIDRETLLREGRIIARITTYSDTAGPTIQTGEYTKFGIPGAGVYYMYVDDGGAADGRRAILFAEDSTIAPVLLQLDIVGGPPHPGGVAHARFQWSDDDDDAWGQCGFSCCRSTGRAVTAGQ